MTTVYISTTGSDAYSYVQAQNPATPWLTVGKANTSATAGDTISIANGTYTFENIVFSTKHFYITTTNLPTVDSPGLKVIMDGGGTSNAISWRFNSSTGSSVSGIKFQNAQNLNSGALGILSNASTSTLTVNDCDFTNLRIYGGYDLGGVFFITGGGGLVLNRCRLYKFYRVNPNTDPIGNILVNGSGTGSTLSLTNCLIYLDGTGSDQFSGSYGFVRWNSGTITTTVKNCVIRNVGTILANGMANAYWGTTTSVTYTGYSGFSDTNAGTGNYIITLDPFVNTSTNDFRPRPNSQLVNAGIIV